MISRHIGMLLVEGSMYILEYQQRIAPQQQKQKDIVCKHPLYIHIHIHIHIQLYQPRNITLCTLASASSLSFLSCSTAQHSTAQHVFFTKARMEFPDAWMDGWMKMLKFFSFLFISTTKEKERKEKNKRVGIYLHLDFPPS